MFVKISEQAFRDWATAYFNGNCTFTLPTRGKELCIAAPVHPGSPDGLEFHIYTSVVPEAGESRDLGKDAIRVVLFDYKAGKAVAPSAKILRTEGKTNPFERIEKHLYEFRDLVETLTFCSKCGAHQVERVNRRTNQKFMGCSAFPKEGLTSYLRDRYPFVDNPYGTERRVEVKQDERLKRVARELAPVTYTELVADEDCIPTSEYPHATFPFPKFNRVQSTIFVNDYWKKDMNLVLGTTTSSGKTVSAELFLAETLHRKKKVVYVSPLKSLTQEKYDEWGERYSKYKISIMTGDYTLGANAAASLNRSDIICLTSEMIDSRTRNYKSEKSEWMFDVGLVIVDETHIISTNRGHAVEAGLMRFCKLVPEAKVLLLSATMPNVTDFRQWLMTINNKPTEVINSDWRPTVLDWHFEEHSSIGKYQQVQEHKKRMALNIVQDKPEEKYLVFVHDKTTGRSLANLFKANEIEAPFHNADLSMTDRMDIEKSFADKEDGLRVLISTSTLAWGRSLPARNVVIVGTTRGINEVDELDIIQMAGRAGRLGIDPKGDCYLVCENSQKWRDKITSPRNVLSQLLDKNVLGFHILAEVKNGEVYDQATLDKWFERSLATVQMDIDSRLVEEVLSKLIEWNMLKVEGGRYEITRLGQVSANLYFMPADVRHWASAFTTIDRENLWHSDLALSYVLGNTPTMRLDYVPRNEQDRVRGYTDAVRRMWPYQAMESVVSCDMHDLLAHGRFSPYTRALQNDIERISQALEWIDLIKRWKRREYWDALPIRVKYGVPQSLVQLCTIPDIGRKRAQALSDEGVTCIKDILNKRDRVERAVGKRLAGKVIADAQRLQHDRA